MSTYTTESDDRGIKQRFEVVELNGIVTVTISTSNANRVINMDRMTMPEHIFNEVAKGILYATVEE